MATLPVINGFDGVPANEAEAVETSDSYRMQIEKEHIKGTVTELDAVAQACYKALNTERYQWPIYSWDYGVELKDLFGKPVPYVFAVLPDRIKDCLEHDERVELVDSFEISHDGKGNVLCKFVVHTIYGDIDITREVNVY